MMGWIKRFQFSAHRFFLHRKLADHIFKRETVNLEKAKKIGLLFNADINENIILVDNFVKYLHENHKQVTTLGFKKIGKSDTPLKFPYFTKKEINWYLKPSGTEVTRFSAKEYDLLINATIEECLPLEYIAATSKAKYRIGHYNPYKIDCYDLMISQSDNVTLEHFLKQVDYYLKMIKYDV